MPRIHCLYEDCIFLEKGFCTAPTIELDPDDGCLTYSEDPGDLNLQGFISEEDEDFGDTWEDAGFEELDDLDFEDGEGF
ncbi:MAG: hypothetical protein PVF83_16150 [Anaerolineales bacterium]|jgi:hypothetical protein